MEVSFCEKWFRHRKKIIGPLNREKAKEFDKNKKSYTALIGNPMQPHCFIEINLGCYGVNFLDKHKRVYLSYSFEEQENEMLFLIEAVYIEYEGNTDNMLTHTNYWFSPDGIVKIGKSEPPFQKVEVTEKKIDVVNNWEKKPEFGNYENLIKKER